MTNPPASNDLEQQRQREWLAGNRRVYPDEVDYGDKGRAQADAGRERRALSDGRAGGHRWGKNGPQQRAMA